VRAAIAAADADGLGALSMRRVAADLGVATMSLYRHVRSKDDLVLLMADAVFLEDTLPDPAPAGWRAQLEDVARLQWTIYKRHPWLAHVLSVTRPQLLPNGMHHTERALHAVEGLGLDPGAMLHAVVTLANYVRGTAVSLESEAQAEQDTGLTDQEWVASQEAAFAAVFATGRFPALARLSAHDIDLNLDSLFEFGLRQLLDGLAARVDGRAVRGAGRRDP
jgi:AcrR family transcriptional regulator